MFALIPVTRISRELKRSVVETVIQYSIYPGQGQRLIAPGMEVEFKFKPVIYFSSGVMFVGHPFKHFLNNRRSGMVNSNLAFLVHQLLIQISQRSHSRPES